MSSPSAKEGEAAPAAKKQQKRTLPLLQKQQAPNPPPSPAAAAAASKNKSTFPSASMLLQKNHPDFPLMLYKLMAFRAKNGHCRIRGRTQLATWVNLLRRCYHDEDHKNNMNDTTSTSTTSSSSSSYLNPERIQILESIEFSWEIPKSRQGSSSSASTDERWEENYQKLIEYKNEHGDCKAPQSTKLGKWVQMQREQYRERQLFESGTQSKTTKRRQTVIPTDRMEKLNAIGFTWKAIDRKASWENKFQELLAYRAVFGHCNVPQAYAENVPLGRWVMKQRVQYNKKLRGEPSNLTDERIRQLQDAGFQWSAASAAGSGVGNKKASLNHHQQTNSNNNKKRSATQAGLQQQQDGHDQGEDSDDEVDEQGNSLEQQQQQQGHHLAYHPHPHPHEQPHQPPQYSAYHHGHYYGAGGDGGDGNTDAPSGPPTSPFRTSQWM